MGGLSGVKISPNLVLFIKNTKFRAFLGGGHTLTFFINFIALYPMRVVCGYTSCELYTQYKIILAKLAKILTWLVTGENMFRKNTVLTLSVNISRTAQHSWKHLYNISVRNKTSNRMKKIIALKTHYLLRYPPAKFSKIRENLFT